MRQATQTNTRSSTRGTSALHWYQLKTPEACASWVTDTACNTNPEALKTLNPLPATQILMPATLNPPQFACDHSCPHVILRLTCSPLVPAGSLAHSCHSESHVAMFASCCTLLQLPLTSPLHTLFPSPMLSLSHNLLIGDCPGLKQPAGPKLAPGCPSLTAAP